MFWNQLFSFAEKKKQFNIIIKHKSSFQFGKSLAKQKHKKKKNFIAKGWYPRSFIRFTNCCIKNVNINKKEKIASSNKSSKKTFSLTAQIQLEFKFLLKVVVWVETWLFIWGKKK